MGGRPVGAVDHTVGPPGAFLGYRVGAGRVRGTWDVHANVQRGRPVSAQHSLAIHPQGVTASWGWKINSATHEMARPTSQWREGSPRSLEKRPKL